MEADDCLVRRWETKQIVFPSLWLIHSISSPFSPQGPSQFGTGYFGQDFNCKSDQNNSKHSILWDQSIESSKELPDSVIIYFNILGVTHGLYNIYFNFCFEKVNPKNCLSVAEPHLWVPPWKALSTQSANFPTAVALLKQREQQW